MPAGAVRSMSFVIGKSPRSSNIQMEVCLEFVCWNMVSWSLGEFSQGTTISSIICVVLPSPVWWYVWHCVMDLVLQTVNEGWFKVDVDLTGLCLVIMREGSVVHDLIFCSCKIDSNNEWILDEWLQECWSESMCSMRTLCTPQNLIQWGYAISLISFFVLRWTLAYYLLHIM